MIFKFNQATLIMGLIILLISILVLYPLFWILLGSIRPDGEFSLQAYYRFFSSPNATEVFLNTAQMAFGTVFLSVLIGVPLAWITGRTDTPFKGFIEVTTLVPFITAPVIGAIAWAILANPRIGLLNLALMEILPFDKSPLNIYSMPGLIFVMSIYVTPYIFLLGNAAIKNMDSSLEDAALIAGASRIKSTFHITLPMIMPALLAAMLIAFVRSIEMFAIPGVLGAPSGIFVLTTHVWRALSLMPPRFGEASVVAFIILLLSGILLYVQRRIVFGEKRYVTVLGKGYRPRLINIGRWKYVALACAFLYLTLAVILPYSVILYLAFIKRWGLPPTLENLTFSNFVRTFQESDTTVRAIKNSLFLGLTGASIALFICTIASYIIIKSKIRGRGFLDFLTLIPLGIPGSVIAVGLLWAYIRPPIVLYGTIVILLVAYITREIPFGVKAVSSSMFQIHQELENSASICGASWFTILRKIIVPLILPGMLAGWTLMFVSMIRELSASILLFSPGNETIAVAIFNAWELGEFNYVAVLALITTLMSLAGVFLARKIFRFQIGG